MIEYKCEFCGSQLDHVKTTAKFIYFRCTNQRCRKGWMKFRDEETKMNKQVALHDELFSTKANEI